jgi:hypothetical protein
MSGRAKRKGKIYSGTLRGMGGMKRNEKKGTTGVYNFSTVSSRWNSMNKTLGWVMAP